MVARYESSTAEIFVSVSSVGRDEASARRPASILGGNYESIPFATVQAALDALPKIARHSPHIYLAAGVYDGACVSGFTGGGWSNSEQVALKIRTAFAEFAPTTGAASGTAGSGTIPTSVVKPTGEDDWTAGDLVGQFLEVTAGGGSSGDSRYPTRRKILANTTTTLSVATVTGMDETSEFRICAPAASFSENADDDVCLRIIGNSVPVKLYGGDFSPNAPARALVYCENNMDVTLMDGVIDQTGTVASIEASGGGSLTVDAVFSASASASISGVRTVNVDALGVAPGQISITKALNATADIEASDAPGSVLSVTSTLYADVTVEANDGVGDADGATVYFADVFKCDCVATGSNNAGYGIKIEGSGNYYLTGSTIEGLNEDLLFDGTEVPWSTIGNVALGMYESHTAAARAIATPAKSVVLGNRDFVGSMDVDSRALFRGYINPAFGESALAVSSATPVDLGTNALLGGAIVNCTHASGTVTLPNGAALAGVLVWIVNIGTETLTVAAPSGGSISGTATIAAGAMGGFISLFSASGKDFQRVAL